MNASRKMVAFLIFCLLALSLAGGAAAQEPQGTSPDVPAESPAAPILGAAKNWKITELDKAAPVGDFAALAIDPGTLMRWVAYRKDAGGVKRAVGPDPFLAGCSSPYYWCSSLTNQDGMYIDYSYPVSGTWAIVYQHTNQPYMYTSECSGPNCLGSYRPIDYQNGAVLGVANSVTHDISGDAHFAYTRSSPAPVELRYAKWVDSGGNCFNSNYDYVNCEIVDSNIGAGGNTDIDTTFTGMPRIAYRGPNGELMLASKLTNTSGNCGPSNTWRCEVIDGSGDVGNYISLHIPKCFLNCTDFMQIAYMNKAAGILKYAKYVANGGNCGPSGSWECSLIASIGYEAGGMGISLQVRNSEPVIAYMDHDDQSNDVLKIARPVGSGGNCAFSTWECKTIDDGYRGFENGNLVFHDVGRFASLDLLPNGRAVIAYQNSTERSLMMIEEVFYSYLPVMMK